jgi:hypothetical protein
VAQKVLFGSTNFSFRGIYIQANNALVVYDPKTAQLFEKVFALAFENAGTPRPQIWFETNAISQQWFDASAPGKPSLKFCFSPHANSSLSMNPVGKAISSVQSSVFFSIAFLNQIKSGPVRSGIDKLMKSRVFGYGISDKTRVSCISPISHRSLPSRSIRNGLAGRGYTNTTSSWSLISTCRQRKFLQDHPTSPRVERKEMATILLSFKIKRSPRHTPSRPFGYSTTCISVFACRRRCRARKAREAAGKPRSRRWKSLPCRNRQVQQ